MQNYNSADELISTYVKKILSETVASHSYFEQDGAGHFIVLRCSTLARFERTQRLLGIEQELLTNAAATTSKPIKQPNRNKGIPRPRIYPAVCDYCQKDFFMATKPRQIYWRRFAVSHADCKSKDTQARAAFMKQHGRNPTPADRYPLSV